MSTFDPDDFTPDPWLSAPAAEVLHCTYPRCGASAVARADLRNPGAASCPDHLPPAHAEVYRLRTGGTPTAGIVAGTGLMPTTTTATWASSSATTDDMRDLKALLGSICDEITELTDEVVGLRDEVKTLSGAVDDLQGQLEEHADKTERQFEEQKEELEMTRKAADMAGEDAREASARLAAAAARTARSSKRGTRRPLAPEPAPPIPKIEPVVPAGKWRVTSAPPEGTVYTNSTSS